MTVAASGSLDRGPLRGARAPTTVAIGYFDGVHVGHQRILQTAQLLAEDDGARNVVVTFDRHPLDLVDPTRRPRLLMSHERRIAEVGSFAGGRVEVLTFGERLRGLSPEQFVDQVIVDRMAARNVVVGENFRFGRGASGDLGALSALCARRGIKVVGAPLVEIEGEIASSSAIRSAVSEGDLAKAAGMLGRAHEMEGSFQVPLRSVAEGNLEGEMLVAARLVAPSSGVFEACFAGPGGEVVEGSCAFPGPERPPLSQVDPDGDGPGGGRALRVRVSIASSESIALGRTRVLLRPIDAPSGRGRLVESAPLGGGSR